MNEPQKITVQVGSTKVYADLGYAGAAEMQRKSRLAGEIAHAVKARRLATGGASKKGCPSATGCFLCSRQTRWRWSFMPG